MKKQISKVIYLLFAIMVIASISFSSCKKEKATPVVTTALADSIAAATTLLTNSVEGVAAGQYQRGSKAALQTTVTAVQTILDDPTSTQTDINNAIANLSAAVTLFKTKAIVPIAEANLIAQWTFSEGAGNTVTDVSSNHLVGTFMEGHSVIVGRGPLPTWCPDRYGVANQALHFSYGGHIEVPYTSILAPTQMTISMWFQVDSLNLADNYMISEDWWNGYKLNLQTATKPFFTFNNGATIYDRDWNANGISDHSWHHLVVTLTDGNESYYGDGALIYTWTNVTGGISILNPQAFVIGQAQPNTLVNVLPADDPSQWGVGYFRGSLDEIRIYNIALTATQVTSIYNTEKPD
jgi:Concanavalin A-like lectin/glucanases superfamily/FIVAR domain